MGAGGPGPSPAARADLYRLPGLPAATSTVTAKAADTGGFTHSWAMSPCDGSTRIRFKRADSSAKAQGFCLVP